jgi:hypothetical protein
MLNQKKAITVVEALVVVLLISIVIGAGIVPYVMQRSMFESQLQLTRLQDNVSIAMAFIEKDLFRASEVNAAGNILVNDINGVLNETIAYALNGSNQITRSVNGGAANVIANHISVFNMTTGVAPNPNNHITISITGQSGRHSISQTSAISLRATQAL